MKIVMNLIKLIDEDNNITYINMDAIRKYSYRRLLNETVIETATGDEIVEGNKCDEITKFLLHEHPNNINRIISL